MLSAQDGDLTITQSVYPKRVFIHGLPHQHLGRLVQLSTFLFFICNTPCLDLPIQVPQQMDSQEIPHNTEESTTWEGLCLMKSTSDEDVVQDLKFHLLSFDEF